ncbi:transcriptional activator RfaH [Pseudomonas rhizophila]
MNIRNAISESTLCKRRKAWYRAQCKSRQDHRAEENLQRKGYACTRPMCRRVRIVRGQPRIVQESRFPRYPFINLPADTDWSPLRSTHGVSRIVSFGGRPLRLANSVVLKLQHRDELMSNFHVTCSERAQSLEPTCIELDIIMVAADGKERMVMLVNCLNRQEQSISHHYT